MRPSALHGKRINIFMQQTTHNYDVVLADPPWQYHGATDKWGAAEKFYRTMRDEDLLAFRGVTDRLSAHGVAFVWATCPRLDFAVQCIAAWGLHYRGVAFVWVKARKDGAPIGAQGVRPSIVKPTVELVLACSRVKQGRPMPLASERVAQVVMAPRREHSRKPEQVYERIEALYPHATKIELFARHRRMGWDAWGDELD